MESWSASGEWRAVPPCRVPQNQLPSTLKQHQAVQGPERWACAQRHDARRCASSASSRSRSLKSRRARAKRQASRSATLSVQSNSTSSSPEPSSGRSRGNASSIEHVNGEFKKLNFKDCHGVKFRLFTEYTQVSS
eukprot:scaffold68740_cov29-Tisochrysis_lutea.AAC.2